MLYWFFFSSNYKKTQRHLKKGPTLNLLFSNPSPLHRYPLHCIEISKSDNLWFIETQLSQQDCNNCPQNTCLYIVFERALALLPCDIRYESYVTFNYVCLLIITFFYLLTLPAQKQIHCNYKKIWPTEINTNFLPKSKRQDTFPNWSTLRRILFFVFTATMIIQEK